MSTWLITGASRGLGRALATAVLGRGDTAIMALRSPEAVDDLIEAHPDTAVAMALDVTDPAQIDHVVATAMDRHGPIDVLVNNAGYGYRSAIEEGEDDEIRRLFETNVFGPVNLTKAVLPGMRGRRRGAIVNISSIGARVSPPGSGYYSATKAALEGLSGSLRTELAPLGIHVLLVEPGGFRTDFGGSSLRQSAAEIDDYADTAGKRRREMAAASGTQPGDPAKGAELIIDAVTAPIPPSFLLLGNDALGAFESTAAAQRADVDAWRDRSAGTDFDS